MPDGYSNAVRFCKPFPNLSQLSNLSLTEQAVYAGWIPANRRTINR